MFEQLARKDFRAAQRRAFWRKLGAWLTGKSNQLLPYEEIRRQLPLQGQRYLGLQTIELNKVIGSVARYRDFDRAFLPVQNETTERWLNISTARYYDVKLPPVDLYKIGEVYFVKDGNHRISVARQQEQEYIDAFVTEISVPIPITPDTVLDEIIQKKEYAHFLQETGIHKILPTVDLQLSMPREYERLKEHIKGHRFLMSQQKGFEMSYEVAVASWYEHFYRPLTETIHTHNLPKQFPQNTITDMYLWVSEYQWLLREWYRGADSLKPVTQELASIYNEKEVRDVLRTLRQSHWIEAMILQDEREQFLQETNWHKVLPETAIEVTAPGNYEKLLQHISAHRWYLGEEIHQPVSYQEALQSWFCHIYQPAIQRIRKQGMLANFPERTEADLYLWTIDNRDRLQERERYLNEVEMVLVG